MAEFTPITTQEEFDKAISARLERERNTVRAEFKDYDSLKTETASLREQLKTAQSEAEKLKGSVAELTTKAKQYETDSVKTRIAMEKGLPKDAISRLQGETEAEISKDADTLAAMFATAKKTQPLYNPEGNHIGSLTDAAMREVAAALGGN